MCIFYGKIKTQKKDCSINEDSKGFTNIVSKEMNSNLKFENGN